MGCGWGFVKSHHYTRSIEGEIFKVIIQEHFLSMLKNSPKAKGKVFPQEGDLSQNKVLAKDETKKRTLLDAAYSKYLQKYQNIYGENTAKKCSKIRQ